MTSQKDKEDCLHLAQELSKILGKNSDDPIKIDDRETGVIIEEINFTGHMSSFYFGETKYPFNIIKDHKKELNHVTVNVINTLQDNKCCEAIEYNDVFSLINELWNKDTRDNLVEALNYLKNERFKVEAPQTSTNKTRLFFYLFKHHTRIKIEVKAEFNNQYMLIGD